MTHDEERSKVPGLGWQREAPGGAHCQRSLEERGPLGISLKG